VMEDRDSITGPCHRAPYPGSAPSVDSLSRFREHVESFGITLDMMPLPMSSNDISRFELPNIMLGKSPDRDREIEGGAFFLHIRRREVDRDALERKLPARVLDRRGDALAAFAHRRIGQPHHREMGQAQ